MNARDLPEKWEKEYRNWWDASRECAADEEEYRGYCKGYADSSKNNAAELRAALEEKPQEIKEVLDEMRQDAKAARDRSDYETSQLLESYIRDLDAQHDQDREWWSEFASELESDATECNRLMQTEDMSDRAFGAMEGREQAMKEVSGTIRKHLGVESDEA